MSSQKKVDEKTDFFVVVLFANLAAKLSQKKTLILVFVAKTP